MDSLKFKQYSLTAIVKLINFGKEMCIKYNGEYINFAYSKDFERVSLDTLNFVIIGFENPDFIPTVNTFYRIGCPKLNMDGDYYPSYNFADNKFEKGISVVTEDWLNSFKSVFFGTFDEQIKRKGVYKIVGFKLPYTGGDDEPLIIALEEAKKTKIRTRNGLMRAVKQKTATK